MRNVYVAVVAAFGAVAACSAPATLGDLARAESLERAGDTDGALAAYRQAQVTCEQLTPARRRRAACGEAAVGEAELLERSGAADAAMARYQAIAESITVDDNPEGNALAALALYRIGTISQTHDDLRTAWTAWWQVVTMFPDEPFAADALGQLLRDGRATEPAPLFDKLATLLTLLANTQVADNLLWSMAELAEHELHDLPAARAYYDRINVDTPNSGLRDDARWRAAQVSITMGDFSGAETRLLALLATREVAFGNGSYFSVWLDNAQLLVGQLRRDHLNNLPGAMHAFAELPNLYPHSLLRDDAAWELANTQVQAGQPEAACTTLRSLANAFPESRYVGRTVNLPSGSPACPATAP